VVGVVVIAVAKPACDYTVKLILRDTSSAVKDTILPIVKENQYIMRELITGFEGKILLILTDLMKQVEMNMNMSLEIKKLLEMMSKESESNRGREDVAELKSTIQSLLIEIKELMLSKVDTNDTTLLKINEYLEMNLKELSVMSSNINVETENKENILVRLNDIANKLPDKDYIETIAKKYAMYLHDEHIELMNMKEPVVTVDDKDNNNNNNNGKPKFSHLKIPTPRSTSNAPKLTMRKPLSARN
jgi:hypothetical protein